MAEQKKKIFITGASGFVGRHFLNDMKTNKYELQRTKS